MVFVYTYADKLDICFISIICKGGKYVSALVDHIGLPGKPGEQSTLDGDGQEYYAEYNVEQIMFQCSSSHYCHNGKYN